MTRLTAWVNRRPKLKQGVVALIEVAETLWRWGKRGFWVLFGIRRLIRGDR
jgi:hypothetical protein